MEVSPEAETQNFGFRIFRMQLDGYIPVDLVMFFYHPQTSAPLYLTVCSANSFFESEGGVRTIMSRTFHRMRHVRAYTDGGWELWGTFSPADHLRPRAFVADVLIYDRLVVPVPDRRDPRLLEKWERWDPARQERLLNIIEEQAGTSVERIPWTRYDEEHWSHALELRQSTAFQLAHEVSRIQRARDVYPDSVDQYAERLYLRDQTDARRDIEMLHGVPSTPVTVVAAYGSATEFGGAIDDIPTARDAEFLSAFTLPLLVPADSKRSDQDLLKEAVELAALDETRQYRLAFHNWRSRLSRHTTALEARGALEDAIEEYADAIKRRRVVTSLRRVMLLVTAAFGGGVSAAFQGPDAGAAVAAGTAGLTMLIEARAARADVPVEFAGALFHEARAKFDWRAARYRDK